MLPFVKTMLLSVFVLVGLEGSFAYATPLTFSWSGRLADDTGRPVAGPVVLELGFYNQQEGGSPLLAARTLSGVALQEGIFQITVTLSIAEWAALTAGRAWIQIKDLTHGRLFARKELSAAAYALKVPVDGKSITHDAQGRMQVTGQESLAVQNTSGVTSSLVPPGGLTQEQTVTWPAAKPGAFSFLSTDGNGGLGWRSLALPAGAASQSQALADLPNPAAARTTLGLGPVAEKNVGTGANDVAAGQHGHSLSQVTNAGPLASLTTVNGTHVDAGVITNAKVAAGAAIAASKINGFGTAAFRDVGNTSTDAAAGNHTHTTTDVTGLGTLATKTTLALSDIADDTLGNAAFANGAAVAGSKIAPNFGSQNITTTGNVTAGSVTSGGIVMIAHDTATCDAGRKGSLRFNTSTNTMQLCDGSDWKALGVAEGSDLTTPVGSIYPWHKSFANTPALPGSWVECNGQVLNDPESVYHNKTLPALNSNVRDGSTSSGLFLRGGPVSGIVQADATAVNGLTATASAAFVTGIINGTVEWYGSPLTYWNLNSATDMPLSFSSTDSETRPANMSVVWIMRVK